MIVYKKKALNSLTVIFFIVLAIFNIYIYIYIYGYTGKKTQINRAYMNE